MFRNDALGFGAMVVVLCAGCSADELMRAPEPTVPVRQTAAPVPNRPLPGDGLASFGERCQKDEDCLYGFCDRGRCAAQFLSSGLGRECDPNEVSGGWKRPGEYPCFGHYPCIDDAGRVYPMQIAGNRTLAGMLCAGASPTFLGIPAGVMGSLRL